jgi:hypothetical protein
MPEVVYVVTNAAGHARATVDQLTQAAGRG